MKIDKLTIRTPDDWHLHLRDGPLLKTVLPFSARQFQRAIIMPNLEQPITTVAAAKKYRESINSNIPAGVSFQPLMTAYLTDEIKSEELKSGFEENVFFGAKLYPAGVTTNSSAGVTNVSNIWKPLATMEKIGLPLLVHGEVTNPSIDIFDREAVFIETVLQPLIKNFPGLKIVFEHVSSSEAVDFVVSSNENIGATITPHHMIITRNAIFEGGIRPHMYCLPVAKREKDRLALRRAAVSGAGKFFLGTDSAPHHAKSKESDCGCAGIFSAVSALEFYAQIFDEEGALGNLESFASINGPKFYGLPVNDTTVTLTRQSQLVPKQISFENGGAIIPFFCGEIIPWSFSGK